MSSLSKQVALVSGASSGIGRAIALSLAQAGARVCLIGRHLDSLNALAQVAEASAYPLAAFQADLSQAADIQALIPRIQSAFGGIDLLIHSAGMISLGTIQDASVTDFDRQYQLNVRAPYLLTQLCLPSLKQRQGQIVFINSSAGLNARAGVAQYAATKHALKALADSLREEVNPDGVRVLSVYPGRTATSMQAEIYAHEGKSYSAEKLLQPEDIAASILNALMLPHSAELTDLHIRPMKKS